MSVSDTDADGTGQGLNAYVPRASPYSDVIQFDHGAAPMYRLAGKISAWMWRTFVVDWTPFFSRTPLSSFITPWKKLCFDHAYLGLNLSEVATRLTVSA